MFFCSCNYIDSYVITTDIFYSIEINITIYVTMSYSPCIRTQFSLEELKKKPLPEGVDPSKLETYLSDKDFEVHKTAIIYVYIRI